MTATEWISLWTLFYTSSCSARNCAFSSSHFAFRVRFSHSTSFCCSRSDLCACIKAWVACAMSSWARRRWASTWSTIWCNWVGSSPIPDVLLIKGTIEISQLDWSAYFTSQSLPLIRLNISSCFASFFSVSSSEISFNTTINKSKSSRVRVVLSVVQVALDLFWDEVFVWVVFLSLEGYSSSLGVVTSPLFCSTFVPPSSSPSPPCAGEIEVVFVNVLGISST